MSKKTVELSDKQQEILTRTINQRQHLQQKVDELLNKEQDMVDLIADMEGIEQYEQATIENGNLVFTIE